MPSEAVTLQTVLVKPALRRFAREGQVANRPACEAENVLLSGIRIFIVGKLQLSEREAGPPCASISIRRLAGSGDYFVTHLSFEHAYWHLRFALLTETSENRKLETVFLTRYAGCASRPHPARCSLCLRDAAFPSRGRWLRSLLRATGPSESSRRG